MIESINRQVESYLKDFHTIKSGKHLGGGRVDVGGVVYKCKRLTPSIEIGYEVLIAFINADPNKGVILGVIR